eukprot:6369967-Heterocapsa_arctica.AAC.1
MLEDVVEQEEGVEAVVEVFVDVVGVVKVNGEIVVVVVELFPGHSFGWLGFQETLGGGLSLKQLDKEERPPSAHQAVVKRTPCRWLPQRVLRVTSR